MLEDPTKKWRELAEQFSVLSRPDPYVKDLLKDMREQQDAVQAMIKGPAEQWRQMEETLSSLKELSKDFYSANDLIKNIQEHQDSFKALTQDPLKEWRQLQDQISTISSSVDWSGVDLYKQLHEQQDSIRHLLKGSTSRWRLVRNQLTGEPHPNPPSSGKSELTESKSLDDDLPKDNHDSDAGKSDPEVGSDDKRS